ncbi:uncharacterized protein LOC142644061 [Castanea sativa]|uniref:uncharacterized protein LOC142644061 n=1 Tax=Castanea sativa TaxID=21020 RepID=UPI003F64ED27
MSEVLNIKINNELMSVDLVLLDEKDNLIHPSIRKSFVNHFRDIQEGKIYRIKYFGVVENKDAYRIVNHKYMIRFYATTSVKLLETNDELIAKQKFELVPFDELKYLADKNTTLIDHGGTYQSQRIGGNQNPSSSLLPMSHPMKLDFPRFSGGEPVKLWFGFKKVKKQGCSDWKSLVQTMHARFGSTAYDDPMEMLTRLRQTTSMAMYKAQFEVLSNRIKGLSASHKLSCFLSRLKDEIRLPVRMLNPQSLNEAFGLSKIQEEYNCSYKRSSKVQLGLVKPLMLGPPKVTPLVDSRNTRLPIKRISPAQMEERKKKGLCYNCDEKWGPGHKCKYAMLFLLDCVEFMLEVNLGVHITELEEGNGISVFVHTLHCQENNVEDAGITLYALSGTLTSSTMRVMGKVRHKSLVILIDSSSTHNFVDTSLFSQLHIPVDASQILEVKVANGTQWLSTLGVIQWDFKLLTMCYSYAQKFVMLHGLRGASTHIQEGTQFLKEPVAELLLEFDAVFATPVGLPPIRGHENQIKLKEGAQDIYQRPYRYPYYQKNTPKAAHAFEMLKDVVSCHLVLALPDFTKPFTVECDASGLGLGAVLMQDHMLIAYHSQTLKGNKLSLSTYEKEFLALVVAVKKWRPYLLGRPFVIKTNHQSLKYLLEQRVGTPAQQRWITKLLGYAFIVEYKQGRENVVADALSRRQGEEVVTSCSVSVPSEPATSASSVPTAFKGTLCMISFPTPTWLSDLKLSYTILVDRLTKYVHFMPLSHPYTATKVANLYLQFVFKLHGMPSTIVNDRDPVFTSLFWKELMRLQGVTLAMSSYHPQTEVVNKSLEHYLRAFAADKPNTWVEWLPLTDFWFNTNFHISSKMTPFEALYGYPPPRVLD